MIKQIYRKKFFRRAYNETRRMKLELAILDNFLNMMDTPAGVQLYSDSFRERMLECRLPYQERIVRNQDEVRSFVPESYIERYFALVQKFDSALQTFDSDWPAYSAVSVA